MVALRRAILMKADPEVSLHAHRLFSGRACLCKKDPPPLFLQWKAFDLLYKMRYILWVATSKSPSPHRTPFLYVQGLIRVMVCTCITFQQEVLYGHKKELGMQYVPYVFHSFLGMQ